MKKILSFLCLLLVCSPAVRAETQVIKQVFDIKTADLDAMYQFIPDYVAIDVGDPSVNIEEARAAALKRVSRRGQDKMQRLLDRAEASMQSKANTGS
ncbi:hypothetical protein ACQKP8_08390 [Photobacterium alginatilyticum]|uniref:hypothetical protein n=1 Tax=Photobacterium alginatilyticum TaxID=1775171 RepID=UPI0040678BE8